MRLVLPRMLIIWATIGAALLLIALALIATARDDARAFNLILLLFAVWVAAGVEGMLRFDALWRPPWHRLSFALAAGLPLLLVAAAISMLATIAVDQRREPIASVIPAGVPHTQALLRQP